MDDKFQAEMMLALTMGGEDPSVAADVVTGMKQRLSQYSDKLPTKGSPFNLWRACGAEEIERGKAAWKSTGIEFGKPSELFVPVKFPKGWKKGRTDHPMWTTLLDDRGRKRANIFYKSGMWDCDAFIDLVTRFSIRRIYFEPDDNMAIQFEILDCDSPIYQTRITNPGPRPDDDAANGDRRKFYKMNDAMIAESRNECRDWLNKNYPNWKDEAAYWD